ncbi:MBL fold metallo-hydrolase [Tumebacillus avium]|uniref:MBL fold metallo-hydrolase n=1 Tax=Tumebacillus avium TaxID=1903704 RepID=A0A1Y0IWB1_9BACL|nr:MBL fold metallo-hydrolase [Tumebacillus avium]
MQENRYLQQLANLNVIESAQVVLPDLVMLRTAIANVCFVGQPGSADWVLVDAGVHFFGGRIADTADELFNGPPKAIVLTHGHFDHVGSVKELAERWDVPVYAHELELPFLTGQDNYVEPDPSVGGGLLARMSFLYPNDGIDLGGRVQALPQDNSVPGMPGWKWIHTPGHTAGHVAFFREQDRALIAGDAFITTRQESALAVLVQELEVHGPPVYFTPDWAAAWDSVKRLAALRPQFAVTGHGLPMGGAELQQGLEKLAREFDTMAIPKHGRYVH